MNEELIAENSGSWEDEDNASAWFHAYNAWATASLPIDMQNAVDVIKRGPNDVHLDHLFVPYAQRSQGWGKKIMRQLISLADSYWVSLTLDPAWIGEEDEPYDLSRWYEQFGFKPARMLRVAQAG